jgi:hypothetical protein
MTEPGVDLKEYLLALIGEQEKRMMLLASERQAQVALALEAAQRATEKAEAEALRAREAQNEWRGSMNDLSGRFATIDSLEAVKTRLNDHGQIMSRLIGGVLVLAALVPIVAVAASWLIQ